MSTTDGIAEQGIRIGKGGRLGNRLASIKGQLQLQFGSSRRGPLTPADRRSATDSPAAPTGQLSERLHIERVVIPQLQGDLRNLQSKVDQRFIGGLDKSEILRPYSDFITSSLTANYQDPVIGDESIITRSTTVSVSRNGHQEQVSAIEAIHRDSLMRREYIVNPRNDNNEQIAEGLMKGDLRRHVSNMGALLNHFGLSYTEENIQKVLQDHIWKGKNHQ